MDTTSINTSAVAAARERSPAKIRKKSKPFHRRTTTTSLRPPKRTISSEHSDGKQSTNSKDEAAGDSAYSVMVDTIAGIFGGMAGKAVEYPADTIKVKLQAQTTTGTSFTGPLDCLRQTIKNSGIRGLYAGLPVPLLGSMAEMGVLFTAMGRIKHYAAKDPENPTLFETCLSGGGAGICASFVLTPVELIKCRMQTRSYAGGAMECVRTSIEQEGAFVFYKGYVGTLLREVPGTAAWFGMYELSLTTLCKKDEEPKSWQVILAGGTGGMGYWGAFYPADTVKTEMQTVSSNGKGGASSTFMESFRNIYRTRGISGLYAGLGPTLARAIPANAAIFYVYDIVSQKMLGKN